MIYTYDTEFLDDGRTIELISIGIIAEDGREYYAVSYDMPIDRIRRHDWLCENVVPGLPLSGGMHYLPGSRDWVFSLDYRDTRVKPRLVIANEVRDFLLAEDAPELWANYAAYDHVALAQLWGPMANLPGGIPMFTRDIQQVAHRVGATLPTQADGLHNALEDARHNMVCLRYLGIVGGAK